MLDVVEEPEVDEWLCDRQTPDRVLVLGPIDRNLDIPSVDGCYVSVRKLLLQLRSKLAGLLLDSIRFARSDRVVPVAMELVRNQVQ